MIKERKKKAGKKGTSMQTHRHYTQKTKQKFRSQLNRNTKNPTNIPIAAIHE